MPTVSFLKKVLPALKLEILRSSISTNALLSCGRTTTTSTPLPVFASHIGLIMFLYFQPPDALGLFVLLGTLIAPVTFRICIVGVIVTIVYRFIRLRHR